MKSHGPRNARILEIISEFSRDLTESKDLYTHHVLRVPLTDGQSLEHETQVLFCSISRIAPNT